METERDANHSQEHEQHATVSTLSWCDRHDDDDDDDDDDDNHHREDQDNQHNVYCQQPSTVLIVGAN